MQYSVKGKVCLSVIVFLVVCGFDYVLANGETPTPTATPTSPTAATQTPTVTPTPTLTPTPTPTETPIPVPTITLELNGEQFFRGDKMFLKIDFSVPQDSYAGSVDLYILVQRPSGKWSSFYEVKEKLPVTIDYMAGDIDKRLENPQMRLKASARSRGVMLCGNFARGIKQKGNNVDVYMALERPDGARFWYVWPNRFYPYGEEHPTLTNYTVQDTYYRDIKDFDLWDRPKGIYKWYGTLVSPGKDVKDKNNRLCGISKVVFETGEVFPEAVFRNAVVPYEKSISIQEDMTLEVGPVIVPVSIPVAGKYLWAVYIVRAGASPPAPAILSGKTIPFTIVETEPLADESNPRQPDGIVYILSH